MQTSKPAVRVNQGTLIIYATSLKVKDLMVEGFYLVDKLDSAEESSGFQRVLDKTRTKRLAGYILDAWKDGDAFLPTSVFLATERNIEYDGENHTIKFDTDNIGPFNVVDGQHRIEGLIEAARENPEIGEFELMANISDNLSEISQMCHFLIVNTTQKSVDRAVEQQIIARLTKMVDIEEIPTLPKWIQRQVLKGEDKEALLIANYLNSEADSVWFQKIRMANELRTPSSTINQKSFVQLTKTYILSASNPLAAVRDIDKRNRILKNYWRAISSLLVDEEAESESIIYKQSAWNCSTLFLKPFSQFCLRSKILP
jgi:DGQHR domain-containing protein